MAKYNLVKLLKIGKKKKNKIKNKPSKSFESFIKTRKVTAYLKTRYASQVCQLNCMHLVSKFLSRSTSINKVII